MKSDAAESEAPLWGEVWSTEYYEKLPSGVQELPACANCAKGSLMLHVGRDRKTRQRVWCDEVREFFSLKHEAGCDPIVWVCAMQMPVLNGADSDDNGLV